eukprot:TRINITY_DN10598_c0_g2_i1.p1 TRINITY_DN10598_c0_g2~~TRINITY_DN10598_c0_g2_i1.p1  ORF type:complete len:308 (-),score=58.66 TRINITY_DN10598_c0_g2_i1:160-1083(-)
MEEEEGAVWDASLLVDRDELLRCVLDKKDGRGHTILSRAAEAGCSQAVQLLCQVDADPLVTNQNLESPIFLAALRGQVNCVRWMLRKLEADYGRPAVLALLNALPPPTHPTVSSDPAVSSVSSASGRRKLPSRLFFGGWTPLHAAAIRQSAGLLRMLLRYGLDVNLKNRYGLTTLHIVAQRGWLEGIQILLSHPYTETHHPNYRLDVLAKDEYGATPLELVLQRNRRDGLTRLEPKWQIIIDLLSAAMPAEATPDHKNSASARRSSNKNPSGGKGQAGQPKSDYQRRDRKPEHKHQNIDSQWRRGQN